MCTIFVQLQSVETQHQFPLWSSGDEGGPSSYEENVLVDDEEELPRSCGFTGIYIYGYRRS